ncbi:MAG: asparagine synthase C-terminal domain-containing protein, partial [Thermodesulfobacteriota bacterium]|nr:asparagine synthase C-terminal domain-containing protein [Thermodesulfobacteriota bacterium]
ATYLPGDILAKVDQSSMAVALESRVPILDHRICAFAHTLPLSMKISNGVGKKLLRRILYKYVPKKLIERPKQGFGIPIDEWLKGPLKPWAEELLSKDRLQKEGFFNPRPIRKRWTEHLAGKANQQYHLWGPLMFQAWLEEYGP